MATLSAVIVPAKALSDGRHKVRIAVAHNGKTRYIVTDIIIDSIKEFKNGMIVKRNDAAYLNTKLRGLLQHFQESIDSLEYVNGISCPDLVYHIKNQGNSRHRTLKSVYEEIMENTHFKEKTAKIHATSWNAVRSILNEDMLVESVTYTSVLLLDKKLRARGLSTGTIRNYITFFMSLVNYAKRCGYVQFSFNPFNGYTLPPVSVRQSWLTVEEVKKIRDLDITKSNLRRCRDLFMLSYYLGGIKMVDLIEINFNESKSHLCYVRKKTENRNKQNKYVEFDIPEEALPIIERYKGDDGRIAVSECERKLVLGTFFGYNMKRLGEATGIKNLVYYSARKSFSQHAYDLGISESVIDYILGHKLGKGGTSLYSYIFVTPKMANAAIRKVLDNLK